MVTANVTRPFDALAARALNLIRRRGAEVDPEHPRLQVTSQRLSMRKIAVES
jgi:hypothetical protein